MSDTPKREMPYVQAPDLKTYTSDVVGIAGPTAGGKYVLEFGCYSARTASQELLPVAGKSEEFSLGRATTEAFVEIGARILIDDATLDSFIKIAAERRKAHGANTKSGS